VACPERRDDDDPSVRRNGVRPSRPSLQTAGRADGRDQRARSFVPPLRGVKEALYQSEQPWIVDHSKYAQAFGAAPTPPSDAIGRTLTWFRERPGSR
jgi:hypothetical protein